MTVAWVERMSADDASTVEPIFIFRFAKPLDQDKLKALSSGAAPQTHSGEEVYATPTGSAYLPSAERGKTLIAGAAQEVEESAEQGGVAPPLRIAVEKMLLASDASRQIVFLFAPGFLYQQSHYFFAGELQPLLAPMRSFLPDDCRAAMLSAHLTNDNLFMELCTLGPIGSSPDSVAQQFLERVAKLPPAVDSALAALGPQQYGKQILQRFPQMVRVLTEFTRAGARTTRPCCAVICRRKRRTIC